MCSKEEEPLVLQQFLRFGETRLITQQLLLQETSERAIEEHRSKDMKRILGESPSHNGGESPQPPVSTAASAAATATPSSPESLRAKSPPPARTTPDHHQQQQNGGGSSPLNRLQNMHPYDYRSGGSGGKDLSAAAVTSMAAAAAAAAAAASLNPIERPIPPTMRTSTSLMPSSVSVPPSVASYHNTLAYGNKVQQWSLLVFATISFQLVSVAPTKFALLYSCRVTACVLQV